MGSRGRIAPAPVAVLRAAQVTPTMTGNDDNRRWSECRSHPFGLWRTIAESSVLSSLAARSSQVVVVNSRGKTNIHSTLPPSRVPLPPILPLALSPSQSAPSVPFRRANERGVSIGQSLPSLPPSFAAITALTWQSLPPSALPCCWPARRAWRCPCNRNEE